RGEDAAAGRAPTPARAAVRAARRGRDVLSAPPLGFAGGLARARLSRRPWPPGGGVPRVQARARARRKQAHTESARTRLHTGGAHRRRPRQPPPPRLFLRALALPAGRCARARAPPPGPAGARRRSAP